MTPYRSRSSRRRRLTVAAIAAALIAAVFPTAALADGDPASDVLVADPPLFLSADSGATDQQQAALQRQLREAAARGNRLDVAVISARSDLGSVTGLWGHAQTYAEFLGTELASSDGGQLLVVMPSGFGVAATGRPVETSLRGLKPRAGELVEATEQAVEQLTGVPAPELSSVTVPAAGSARFGLGWWLTTAAAIVVVVAAWAASLRVRPARRSRRYGLGNVARH